MKINVNGKDLEIMTDVLSYEDIVKLAGMGCTPSVTYLMEFKDVQKGRTFRDEGILAPGEILTDVYEGAIFTVCYTNHACSPMRTSSSWPTWAARLP